MSEKEKGHFMLRHEYKYIFNMVVSTRTSKMTKTKKNLPSGPTKGRRSRSAKAPTASSSAKKNTKTSKTKTVVNKAKKTVSKTKKVVSKTNKHKGTPAAEEKKSVKIIRPVLDKIDDMLVITHDNNTVWDTFADLTGKLIEAHQKEKNPKVHKMYAGYQKKWFNFMKKYNMVEPKDEEALISFFFEMKEKYAVSTLWVIYSCINSWYIEKLGFDLKIYIKLRRTLKNFSSHYVAKKSNVFSQQEIHNIVTIWQKHGNDAEYSYGIAILLLYYGLLRIQDVEKITKDDVKYNEKDDVYEVHFMYKRKRLNAGLIYIIPQVYTTYMRDYINQIGTVAGDTEEEAKARKFLRNMNTKQGKRLNNMGVNNIRSIARKAATQLGYDAELSKKFTGHAWRRSAATNLADEGVTLTNLKRHGQWQSEKVVEGYMANSKPLREERKNLLLPKELRPEKDTDANEKQIRNVVNLVLEEQKKNSNDDDSKVSDNSKMIEYEDISDVQRHLPLLESSQIGFSQLPLNEDEEAVYDGDWYGTPMFSKKRKSHPLDAITPPPAVTTEKNQVAVKKQKNKHTFNTTPGNTYNQCTVHITINALPGSLNLKEFGI